MGEEPANPNYNVFLILNVWDGLGILYLFYNHVFPEKVNYLSIETIEN